MKTDEETRKRRAVLKKLKAMTRKQRFELAVRAGIFTATGQLTARYRDRTSATTKASASSRSRQARTA